MHSLLRLTSTFQCAFKLLLLFIAWQILSMWWIFHCVHWLYLHTLGSILSFLIWNNYKNNFYKCWYKHLLTKSSTWFETWAYVCLIVWCQTLEEILIPDCKNCFQNGNGRVDSLHYVKRISCLPIFSGGGWYPCFGFVPSQGGDVTLLSFFAVPHKLWCWASFHVLICHCMPYFSFSLSQIQACYWIR